MPVESVKVPDLGDSKDVEVIEILVKEGQSIEENEDIIVLETDKAAMEIPASQGGTVKSITVKVGDTVNQGDEILTVEADSAGDSSEEESAEAASDEPEEATEEKEPSPEPESEPDEEEDAGDESAAASGGIEQVDVPDIGDESDVEVIEIHVSEGDRISAEDPLITLESDKAAMDIPAPKGGEVKSVKIKVGDLVSKGSPILELVVSGGDAKPADGGKSGKKDEAAKDSGASRAEKSDTAGKADEDEKKLQQKQQQYAEKAAAQASGKIYAGPAVRKLARELGVDLTQVDGSGAKGRIQKEDVHEFVKARLGGGSASSTGATSGAGIPAVPDIDFSQFGEVEEVSMSKLHRVTAENMHRNWLNVPAVAQFNEADVTDLEDFRAAQKKLAEKKGVKLTPLPFLIKACAKALEEYPQFNVSLHSSGEKLIQKKYVHIGVAVATEAGLMVPVLKNVDQKSIWQLSEEFATLAEKARSRRLGKEDMQGACFTISSLGAIGGTGFTPIVNSPEVGILGVSKTEIKPVWNGKEFVPRKMLPFSLCYDHRAVNGMDAGQFATYLGELLSDIRLLMM